MRDICKMFYRQLESIALRLPTVAKVAVMSEQLTL